jgi:hypothetical protein
MGILIPLAPYMLVYRASTSPHRPQKYYLVRGRGNMSRERDGCIHPVVAVGFYIKVAGDIDLGVAVLNWDMQSSIVICIFS